MANYLRMAQVHAILSLHKLQWSARSIARRLGIHRETVARHIRLAGECSKPARQAPLGSVALDPEASTGLNPPKPATQAPIGSLPGVVPLAGVAPASDGGFIALLPTADIDTLVGTVAEDRALLGSNLSAAAEPYGTGGPDNFGAACFIAGEPPREPVNTGGQVSQCRRYHEMILSKVSQGLTAQRIYQDLVTDSSFTGSYYSVRRYVKKLSVTRELPFRRMECLPGEEGQADFGTGAPVVDREGRRRPYVFRFVLSHSRKGYSEAVFRQRTEDFLSCLENAFWHVGGVPKVIVIDNLKAAVKNPDWYDPELNPRIHAFCEHYGTVIMPTKSYTPRHKGKVERGVAYVQANALQGRTFASLAEENRHLQQWEAMVADTRIHGTTRQQVGKVFQEAERSALLPLPAGRFPFFHEARRAVHRDGHVEVEKAYYSVPPEYAGRRVWVRWDGRMVRIYNRRMEQIAVHAQQTPGKFSTQGQHIHSRKVSAAEYSGTSLLRKASYIGPFADQWAQAMLQARGIPGVRVLVGFLSMARRYRSSQIERACQVALTHQAFYLRTLRELIHRGGDMQNEFEFLQKHQIIRDLGDYGQLVRESIRQEPAVLQPLES